MFDFTHTINLHFYFMNLNSVYSDHSLSIFWRFLYYIFLTKVVFLPFLSFVNKSRVAKKISSVICSHL